MLERWAILLAVALASGTAVAQSVLTTEPLAPWAGFMYTPAPGQSNIGFYGTDLGWTVKHEGQLRVLFGDTARSSTSRVGQDPPYTSFGDSFADDVMAGVCLQAIGCPLGLPIYRDGDDVDWWVFTHPPGAGEVSWQAEGPQLWFHTNLFTGEVDPIDVHFAGTQLFSGPLVVPGAAFSNAKSGLASGLYAVFGPGPTVECNADPECPEGLLCDTARQFCFDPTSPMQFLPDPDEAQVYSRAQVLAVGNSFSIDLTRFDSRPWVTNKFAVPTITTVNSFRPTRIVGSVLNDFNPPNAWETGNEKVFIWGRPTVVGPYGTAWVYFAYVDMPSYSPSGNFAWEPQYFTGVVDNRPTFSPVEADAVPLALQSDGSPWEDYDIVNHTSIRWVEPLQKWMMIYGGNDWDALLDGLQLLDDINRDPANAIYVRFAEQPWGPWSEPEPLLIGGDPFVVPGGAPSEYGAGGIMFHAQCDSVASDCAPTDPLYAPFPHEGWGFLYGVNIIEEWTMNRFGAVDIYWTVSTWDPYQTVLMKSRIAK